MTDVSLGGPDEARRRDDVRSLLIRAGVMDLGTASRLLADDAVVTVFGEINTDHPVFDLLGAAADPDLALLSLGRIACSMHSDPPAADCLRQLLAAEPGRARLAGVLGSSQALGADLARHPESLWNLADPDENRPPEPLARVDLLSAVGADPAAAVPVAAMSGPEGYDAMRRAYRNRLIRIAATDLAAADPTKIVHIVSGALADLATAALEAALALARAETEDHELVRLAVIAMGKTGGRELNYVSDVDVIYVAEPAQADVDDATLAQVGTRLAAALARACAAPSTEPALWVVDANLRPEGRNGPLVRTLDSHLEYYKRWAKTWEFQALLKARAVAGDRELGEAYVTATRPFVWSAASRPNFVVDSQAMRRRVEENVPPEEADRQIKLGRGGLRDVEFTVQLLQLVHGRADETLRSPNTLIALDALTTGGYVGRTDAAELAAAYRFLRVLEHRIQVHRMRRSQLMPTAEADLRRLGRSLGYRHDAAGEITESWRTVRRRVRTLHESLYYRPLLPAIAQLSPEEASLAPEAAHARLASVGFRDPAGAMRHITALTEGLSRRAAIQRQLLPAMIGWFAEGVDPDAGLAAFRRISDELGATHWYLRLLRDSGVAARRLAQLLSTSQLVAETLIRAPGSVTWLGDNAELRPLSRSRLAGEVDAIVARAENSRQAVLSVRGLRRRENARVAAGWLLDVAETREVAEALTDTADLLLDAALRLASADVAAENDLDRLPTSMHVIAMGRLGGREMGYGSDADVMFVHDPDSDTDPEQAQRLATMVATRLRALLQETGTEPTLEVDADLRPEGRNGPLVRSLVSYAEYYARWASPWEAQALLRARPAAGDVGLGERFVELIDQYRYPAGGIDRKAIKEIQRIKARVEAERLPRGVDPARHLKLGRGGIADVEWTVQLLQLAHAGDVPALRTTTTLDALQAAVDAGLVAPHDARILAHAWELASSLRDAVVMYSGRRSGSGSDLLPHDLRDLAGVARILGYPAGAAADLEEDYLRASRRCRQVMERLFYGAS